MKAYDAGWYSVVEAEHEIQNPVSAETIRMLGRQLGLGRRSRVMDLGCGTCGPALILAEEFGCRMLCVDSTPAFVMAARERIELAGMERWIELVEADASKLEMYEKRRYHAALCLGASFVFGGFLPTLERLAEVAPLVAVGEPYKRMADAVNLAESIDAEVVAVFASTEKDWDDYESQRMRTLERWLDEPTRLAGVDYEKLRDREREAQERRRHERRGWAIFVCRV